MTFPWATRCLVRSSPPYIPLRLQRPLRRTYAAAPPSTKTRSSIPAKKNTPLHLTRTSTAIAKATSASNSPLIRNPAAAADAAPATSPSASSRLNPPLNTLPPPLSLPDRGSRSLPIHYFHVGRAYGAFYKASLIAIYHNIRAARALRQTHLLPRRSTAWPAAILARDRHLLSRADYQLLHRVRHDVRRLPIFALLALVCGEWLPLLVPWIPRVVPGPSRIPSQVHGMRRRAETRRAVAMRAGVREPRVLAGAQRQGKTEVAKTEWDAAIDEAFCARAVAELDVEQTRLLSTTLDLHGVMWDKIGSGPPGWMMRRAVARRLAYLAGDDALLLREGTAHDVAGALSRAEVERACEERGMDVLDTGEKELRKRLAEWLRRQGKDRGKGEAMLVMLFRRPNAWETLGGRLAQ